MNKGDRWQTQLPSPNTLTPLTAPRGSFHELDLEYCGRQCELKKTPSSPPREWGCGDYYIWDTAPLLSLEIF